MTLLSELHCTLNTQSLLPLFKNLMKCYAINLNYQEVEAFNVMFKNFIFKIFMVDYS